MNIDKELQFSCPDECGQIAVSCSIRMILENSSFFCDACGCEFQGTVYPSWLSTASHHLLRPEESQLCKSMQALYLYIYAGGCCPANSFLTELLIAYPQYWHLFPSQNLPVEAIIKLLAEDADFAASFDFSSLASGNWLALMAKDVHYAAKCPWEKVSQYIIETDDALPLAFLQKRELVFAESGLKDSRYFSATSSDWKTKIANPIVFAKKVGWQKHLNWDAFTEKEIFYSFQAYPELLGSYPFTKSNVATFDWNRYNLSNMARAMNIIPKDSPLRKIYSLLSGNNVEEILNENPEWEKYCSWSKISTAEWRRLIVASGKWSSRCPWHIFIASDWIYILQYRPDFASICPWQIFHFEDWMQLFKIDINYADKCDWQKITPENWVALIIEYPTLASHCNWSLLTEKEWIKLFKTNGKYLGKCSRWDIFSSSDWILIFSIDKSMDAKCPNWNIFSSAQWCMILSKYPDYSKHCKWKNIIFNDWKKILTEDLLNRKNFEKKNHRCDCVWYRLFKFEDVKHPKYLAIFRLLYGLEISDTLHLFPEYENIYLDWNMVKAEEWLSCLAKNAKYASRCTAVHWGKILDYIRTLPETQQHSAKKYSMQLWNNRAEILENARRFEISSLPAVDFYLLIDFMDWEWDDHFSWEALDKEHVLNLVKSHPEFIEKYGFDNISNKEMGQLLLSSSRFMDYCMEKIREKDSGSTAFIRITSHDVIAAILTARHDLYSEIKPYFSLNLKDRICFRYYGIEKLLCKVAFFRLFIMQFVIFVLGTVLIFANLFGYSAPCSINTCTVCTYCGFAMVWSLVLAKIHDLCGKEAASTILGIIHGAIGVAFFRFSCPLNNLAQPLHLMLMGLYVLYLIILLRVRHNSCVDH